MRIDKFICCSVAIVIIIVIILLFYVNKLACKDQILQFYPRRLGVYNSAGGVFAKVGINYMMEGNFKLR